MDILSKLKKWNKADYVLLTAGGVFFLALAVKMSYPDNLAAKLFLTVAEAGLVGGIADWFAVTALFRRPLGFPYHTALVPRNRKRLIDVLAKAVEEDFLSKEAIKKRLTATNLADWLIDKLENTYKDRAVSFIREIMTGLIHKAIASLDPVCVGRYGGEVMKKTLQTEPITPYLAQASQWAADTGKTALLYDFLLDGLSKFFSRPETRQKIYNYLQNLKTSSTRGSGLAGLFAWVMEETDSLNLSEAASILQAEILVTLSDSQAENHPVRHWFLGQTAIMAKSLADNTAWAEAAEAGKNAFLSKLDLAAPLAAASASLQEMAAESCPERPSLLESRIMDFLMAEATKYWQVFKTNLEMKEKAEEFFHYLADSLLENSHSLIGAVVRDALSNLTDKDFVQFVEEKTSEDLAWIRINGVAVGSLAGLLLGLLLHFVYDPFLKQ